MNHAVKKERDEQFCSVVLGFAKAKAAFDELLAEYREKGAMDFPRLDVFVESTLFTLKEDSHFLFRQRNHMHGDQISEEELFDISIGSIFHELMKIKENVYQIEHYAPLYSQMAKSAGRPGAPDFEVAFLEACHKIVRRARRMLPSDLGGAEEIFRDAADNLKMMLRNHTGNQLLARTFLDHQELMKRAFGVDDIDKILAGIYRGRIDEACLAAARDYLEGGWYDKARVEAEKVIKIDPGNLEASQIISKLSGKLSETRKS